MRTLSANKMVIRMLFVMAAVFLITLCFPGRASAAATSKITSPAEGASFDLGKSITVRTQAQDIGHMSGQQRIYFYYRVIYDGATYKYAHSSGSRVTNANWSFTPENEGAYQIQTALFITSSSEEVSEEDFVPDQSINVSVIRDLSKSDVQITGLSDLTYTGSALIQAPVVTVGDKTLNPETDYTVSCSQNVDAGEATVMITGTGFYKGSVSGHFQILPMSISGAAVSSIPDQSFTGAEILPAVSVSIGGGYADE